VFACGGSLGETFAAHLRSTSLRHLRCKAAADDAGSLLWVLAAGLLLNLLPIRWSAIGGSFGENPQAWFLVFVAVVVRGLKRLPLPLVAVLMLAMAAEFALVDSDHQPDAIRCIASGAFRRGSRWPSTSRS
jgi:hypothetical protein